MTILLLALAVIAAGGFILTQVGIAVTIGFVAMVLAGVVGAGLGIWGMYNAVLDYLDDESDRGELVINLLKRGAVLVLSGIVLFNSVPQVWTAFSDWRISQQQEQLPPDDGADSGSLDHLKIDMDDRDLENWLAEFNSNWRVEMLNTWDDSSMPSNAEARNKAVHDAGGKFEYAVSTPMQDLKILLDGSYTDGTLAQIKKGIQKKIIMDPIYADGFVQACRLMAPEILTLNPWLQEYADWLDEVFGRTDSTTKGINALLNDDCTALRTDVFYNNVRLAVLFSQFTAVGVEAAESSHNWHLPIVAKASDTRLVESPVQESSAAVIFVARYKLADGTEGECAIKIGINVWDKRIELFNPKAPVQPPKEDKPTGNGDPVKKPDEGTYTVYMIGYDWADKTTVVLEKTTYRTKVADGTTLNVPAPDVKNYVVHPGYDTVQVTVSGDSVTAKFYYDKIPAQAKTYPVTVIGYDWSDKKTVVVSEYTVYTAVPNGTYTVTAPNKAGYTIHEGYETVSATVNNAPGKAVVYYDKVTDHRLYYQRGYYSLNGKWTLLDANPIYVGTYAAGADYGFNVSAPSSNDQNTRYILRDNSRVTGRMPSEDYVVPVVCLVQHDIDISYKKVTDTGSVKAFEPYKDWVTEGARFSIPIYELKGYTPKWDFATSGTMGTKPIYGTVFYYKDGQTPDGGGAKLPQTDPVNTERDDGSGKSNAEVGGGENLPGDGNGGHQTSDPGASDYPAQGSNDTNKPGGSSGNNDTSNTTTGNNGGANTVTGGDHQTSGETGKPAGGDETVKADDGGTTHGGTTDSNPITPVDNTTVTTTTDNGNGTSTTTTENTGGQTFDGQYSGGEPQ